MFAQIKAACPENSNLQELAVCSGESHFDGRTVIMQRQFSSWKGEGYSCSSPGTVTKWVPHSHCTLFEVAPPDDCVWLLCTWLLREEVLGKGRVCLQPGTLYEDTRLSIRDEKCSPKCREHWIYSLSSIYTSEILRVLTSLSASLNLSSFLTLFSAFSWFCGDKSTDVSERQGNVCPACSLHLEGPVHHGKSLQEFYLVVLPLQRSAMV